MPAKERLTKKEIEIDIKRNLKAPKEMTEDTYKKWSAIGYALAIPIVVLFFVNYRIALWAFFSLAALEILLLVARFSGKRRQSRTATIEDYEITVAPLLHSKAERYAQKEWSRKRRVTRRIENYFLAFEGRDLYQIPEENYRWSREYVLSDFFIFQNAHRGDAFILAIRKETGEIAAVYPTAFFDYKE